MLKIAKVLLRTSDKGPQLNSPLMPSHLSSNQVALLGALHSSSVIVFAF